MRGLCKYFIYLNVVCLLIACQTSKTFYSATSTTLTGTAATYRLDVSESTHAVNLSKYQNLKMLNLSGIKNIQVIDSILESVPNPTQLRVLILDNNYLKSLPTAITRFSKLEQLSLNNNQELDFSKAFTTLAPLPLTFLNCQFNQLKTVPKEIVYLEMLKDLNFSNNQLELHHSFKYLALLPKLTSLWLRNNHLTSLSANLNKMSRLVNLYVENNELEELPKQLEGLQSLRILHLSFNRFKELPEVLQTLPHLILLHIDHCNIQKISNTFSTETTSIRGLVMNDNQLTSSSIKLWKSKFKSFFLLIF